MFLLPSLFLLSFLDTPLCRLKTPKNLRSPSGQGPSILAKHPFARETLPLLLANVAGALDFHVFLSQVLDVFDEIVLFDTAELAVAHGDVTDRRFFETPQGDGAGTGFAGQVFDDDVAENGDVVAARAFLIVEISMDDGVGNAANTNVAGMDVLNHASANGVGLES